MGSVPPVPHRPTVTGMLLMPVVTDVVLRRVGTGILPKPEVVTRPGASLVAGLTRVSMIVIIAPSAHDFARSMVDPVPQFVRPAHPPNIPPTGMDERASRMRNHPQDAAARGVRCCRSWA